MSRQTNKSNNYKGRYNEPVPTTNLGENGDDFPEFEAFDDEPTPRGNTADSASLMVLKVDMCQQINGPNHRTTFYDTRNLVVRRGQEFVMRVTFNRPLADGDDIQVEFLIGTSPSPLQGSHVAVTFGDRRGGPWSGRILEHQGESVMLVITPRPNAIVGKFRTYVGIVVAGGVQRTRRDASTDLYLLFNAWCPEDAVFLPDEEERREYVLNDCGMIYQGSLDAVANRDWVYGQFEGGILDTCIYILDVSRMPIYNRGDCIKTVRKGSAMINSQDDNGVCVGNWSDNYSMGRSPMSWTGSTPILLQFADTGVPVCYAQCWVFAGVFNTFLRAIGIPARVVTNFNSAHDNTGNLKTDLICKPDGSPDERNTRDSIWNYHCWNEVWIARPDLPPGLGGWQVVDATPQETSDGHFRCGPSSVAAIKEGLLCHPYDAGFVFAEVNSDVVFHKRDRYGTVTPFRVERTHIGKAIYTKSLGNDNSPRDITDTYKYPEGSSEDSRTMSRAEEYGCERDHSDLPETNLSVVINAQQVQLGQDVNLQVDFINQGVQAKTIQAHLTGSVIFYTGVRSNRFKDHDFTVTVPANQTRTEMFTIRFQDYSPHLGSQLCLHFVVTGQADDQSITAIKVLDLLTSMLTVTVSGQPQVQKEMFVTISFTNPFNFSLNNVHLAMDGPGLMSERRHSYSSIDPQASISWKESFTPRLDGYRCIVAVMDSDRLRHVWGVAYVIVAAARDDWFTELRLPPVATSATSATSATHPPITAASF